MAIATALLMLLHVFTAVFWFGSSIFLANFVLPVALSGDESDGRFMRRLAERTRFPVAFGIAASVTVLSGIALLGVVSGWRGSYFATSSGMTLGLGALCGITAFVLGVVTGAAGRRMATAEQGVRAEDMLAAGRRMRTRARATLAFMGLALTGMTVAPFV